MEIDEYGRVIGETTEPFEAEPTNNVCGLGC